MKNEKIINQIIALEKQGTEEAYKKLEEIASTLTLEEMLSIDDYIMQNNLLQGDEKT